MVRLFGVHRLEAVSVADSDDGLDREDGDQLGFFSRSVACLTVSLVGVLGRSCGQRDL